MSRRDTTEHWKYCSLCEKAVRYTPDMFDMQESIRRELDIRMYEHQLHLCGTCRSDFATCEGSPEFGNCVGNDNVVNCANWSA